jgi:hypothetical protein
MHKRQASPLLEDSGDAHRSKRMRNAVDGEATHVPPPEATVPPEETGTRPQRAPDPVGTDPGPSTSTAPSPRASKEEGEVQEAPPETKVSRKKPRRGEGQTPVPTSYQLPQELPRAPTPPIDTSPADVFLSETIEDAVDDESWKEDLWDVIEGESKQQVQQRLAHNHRVTEAHKKKKKSKGRDTEEEIRKCRRYNQSRAGRVPDGTGVVTVNQLPEHSNVFHGLLARHFYHSPPSNCVYAGRTAVEAMQADTDGAEVDEHNRRLYKVARQGFPMNPQEVYDLVALVNDRQAAPIDRAEGFLLITELCCITTLSVDQ